MSDILLDIESLLTSTESNIYIGSKPDTSDTPDNIISLYATGGFPAVNNISGDVVRNPTFQVIVRDIDYSNGHSRAEVIVNILNGIVNRVINGNDYISISLYSDIFPLGRDVKDRTEFSINFRAILNN